MRVAIALGGTDQGRSGLGTWVRAVVPRLSNRFSGGLVALGTARDLDAYAGVLAGIEQMVVPSRFDAPAASALWHLWMAGGAAREAGANVLLLAAANRRVALRSPVPTVAVVHDLAQLQVPGKYDALRTFYLRTCVLSALRRNRVLVAVSEMTRDQLALALGKQSASIRVVRNGVEAERFLPPAPADDRVAQARAATGLEGPYLLYPSRLEHPGKNHLRLLRAFAASRLRATHRLALVGADWGAAAMLHAEVARLGLAGRVAVLGFIDDALMPGLVAGADAVVMVGLCEGFGLPALEALAAARVVVAARSGALPEVVGSLAVFCDPLSEESIKSALEQAVFEPVFRERALREGPAWASARSWNGTAQGLADACAAAVRS